MVQSKLHEKLNYEERKEVSESDKDYDASMYVIPIFSKYYTIALGREKTEHVDKYGIIYYPIYFLSQDDKKETTSQGCIGVFEIEKESMGTVLDKDGDVNIVKLHGPVLFSFVNEAYLEKGFYDDELSAVTLHSSPSTTSPAKDDELEEGEVNEKEEEEEGEELEEGEEEDDEDDELYKTSEFATTTTNGETPVNDSTVDKDERVYTIDNIFIPANPMPSIEPLVKETPKEAETICKSYKVKKSFHWLNNIMKNPNYKVINVPEDGNCFFTVIQRAFESIGKVTTIEKLRGFLSQNITMQHYDNYKTIYENLLNMEGGLASEEKELKDKSNSLRKENEKATTVESQKEIIEMAKDVRKQHELVKSNLEGNKEMLQEFSFMADVHSLDDLREFVKTPDYWIDNTSLPIIEELLNTKTIVLEESDKRSSIVKCSPVAHEMDPNHYIILEYLKGNHYQEVTYRSKKIFQFDEFPYSLKKVVVDTCIPKIEENRVTSDSIYKVKAFRDFYGHLHGKSPEEEAQVIQQKHFSDPKTSKEPSVGLYDDNIHIAFSLKSNKTKKVGEDSKDIIKNQVDKGQFAILQSKQGGKMLYPLWRRRLDDAWVNCSTSASSSLKDCNDQELAAPFTTKDNKKWASVKHYLLALEFEKENPELYESLSLDSVDSSINNNWTEVEKLLKKPDMKKKAKSFPTIERYEDFRKEALMAKFSQNIDLKNILLRTNMAKLVRVMESPKRVEPDISLMEVRQALAVP